MRAIRLHRRGGPDELVLEDAPVPEIGAGDVLVRVSATGITPTELRWDETYQHADGTPRIPSIPGHEVSGVVERVAPDVEDFRPGDAVYGLADFPRDGAAAKAYKTLTLEESKHFWSFQAPQKRTPPAVANQAWPRSDVDRFLLAKMEA